MISDPWGRGISTMIQNSEYIMYKKYLCDQQIELKQSILVGPWPCSYPSAGLSFAEELATQLEAVCSHSSIRGFSSPEMLLIASTS